TPVAGQRERDLRNGVKELLTRKCGQMLRFVTQVLAKPRWLARFVADGGLMKFPNVVIPGEGALPSDTVDAALAHSMVTWQALGLCWSDALMPTGLAPLAARVSREQSRSFAPISFALSSYSVAPRPPSWTDRL